MPTRASFHLENSFGSGSKGTEQTDYRRQPVPTDPERTTHLAPPCVVLVLECWARSGHPPPVHPPSLEPWATAHHVDHPRTHPTTPRRV